MRDRASNKGLGTQHWTYQLLFPRIQNPRSSLLSKPDVQPFTQSPALLWAYHNVDLFKFHPSTKIGNFHISSMCSTCAGTFIVMDIVRLLTLSDYWFASGSLRLIGLGQMSTLTILNLALNLYVMYLHNTYAAYIHVSCFFTFNGFVCR